MDIICLQEMGDIYFIDRRPYSLTCLLPLASGVFSYVVLSKRSLNAHFEKKPFLFFQGFPLESGNPNFELFSVSVRQVYFF